MSQTNNDNKGFIWLSQIERENDGAFAKKVFEAFSATTTPVASGFTKNDRQVNNDTASRWGQFFAS